MFLRKKFIAQNAYITVQVTLGISDLSVQLKKLVRGIKGSRRK